MQEMPYIQGGAEVQGTGRGGQLFLEMTKGTMVEESEGMRKSEADCGKWTESWKPEAETCWSNY